MPGRVSPMTRRQFGFCLCGVPFSASLRAAEQQSMPWSEPAEVRKVYFADTRIHWPKPDLDVQREVAEIDARLADVERKHSKDFRFVGGDLLRTSEEVEPWLKRLGDADALLAIPLSAPTGPLAEVLDTVKIPALYFSRPYAGHGWSGIAARRKRGQKVDALATSSYDDLDPYASIFRTIRHLRKSKVLVVTDRPEGREALAAGFGKQFGTQMKFFRQRDMNAVLEGADARKAQQLADEFTRGALRVVESTPEEIHDAMRFYIGLADLLQREKANAITIDCFGALLAGVLPAYPCAAWSKLNDQGLYGVCEGDLPSTMTQMLVTSNSGMPGFVSDPVFDVSRNEVIHAHCVAATKMKGIDGPSYPYLIRHHLETSEGVTLQVLMPSGETITCARFASPDSFLVSTAEVTGTVDSDRGCRSQIRTRVTDAQKMLENYSAGLHRVIFYGDHTRSIERMGRLMGFEVVHEI